MKSDYFARFSSSRVFISRLFKYFQTASISTFIENHAPCQGHSSVSAVDI